jgi:hypothetical protein
MGIRNAASKAKALIVYGVLASEVQLRENWDVWIGRHAACTGLSLRSSSSSGKTSSKKR